MKALLSLDPFFEVFLGLKLCQADMELKMTDNWKPRTRAVHGGTRRSQYGEVSEAIFLTQGYVYNDAESAESRFLELDQMNLFTPGMEIQQYECLKSG